MDSDVDAKKAEIQSRIRAIEAWKNDSLTRELAVANQANQDILVAALCEFTPETLGDFAQMLQRVGALRGLRQSAKAVETSLVQLRAELKELE